MSADKPEAGRSCCDLHRMTVKDDNRCLWILPNGDATDVNPAPRPVEDPGEQLRPVAEKFAQRNRDIEDGKWPRPVERCPCEESVALRKALKDIDKRIGGFVGHPGTTMRDIYDIARRALALGGEG